MGHHSESFLQLTLAALSALAVCIMLVWKTIFMYVQLHTCTKCVCVSISMYVFVYVCMYICIIPHGYSN